MKFAVFDHLDRSGPDLVRQYEERLRLIEIYEWADFHAYHVAEHHGTPLGMAPSPGLFLASVAQRTTTLRFGPLVYPLGLYHPLRLIEEICMLDTLSDGRLELGVGRGASPYEAGFFGIDPRSSVERFEEALEILMRGLGSKQLDYKGKFYSFDNVPLALQPVQRPHPPLWVATRTLDGAPYLARQGSNVALSLPTRDAGEFVARFKAAWVALGRDLDDVPFLGNTRNVVVADNDREAHSSARRAFKVWYDSLVHLWRAHGMELPTQIFPSDYDEAVALGYVVAGSPSTVRDRLRHDDQISDINYSICRFAYGDLAYEESARSVRLFAREVMPAFESDAQRERRRAATGSLVGGLRWVGAESLTDVGFLFR